MLRIHLLLPGFLCVYLTFLLSATVASAAKIIDLKVPSAAMKTDIPATILLPNSYSKGHKSYPVVYMLPGYSSDNRTVLTFAEDIVTQAADNYNMIIVMPDGGFNSWYFDSPLIPEKQYETHISSELIEYIDSHYRANKSRNARAITGGSMGGHGAMYLALRHKELYCAVGSMSGNVDFRLWPDEWDVKQILGPKDQFPQRWDDGAVMNNLNRLKPGDLSICVDVGTKDPFLEVNRTMHQKLLDMGIEHTYIERPGQHDNPYWREAIRHQLFFFDEVFREKQLKEP